ncbi:MAG: peptidase, partial [Frankiales bacterium]|nr:peptidase [Frankiales bacterium]
RLHRAAPAAAVGTEVAGWFRSHGFAVRSGDGWTLDVTAPAGVAAATFGTTVTRRDGGWQSAGPAVLPAALRGRVVSVVGLDTTDRLEHHTHLDRSMFLDGGDLRAAYSAPAGSSSSGQGTTIASVQFAGWNRTDLCTFVDGDESPSYNRTIATPRFADRPTLCPSTGATGATIDQRRVDGFDPQVRNLASGQESLEVALDQEALLAVAPRANQRIYFAANNATGWVHAFRQIADDAEADIAAGTPTVVAVSVSWGMCELTFGRGGKEDPIPAWEQQLQRLTALGIPIFAATGDAGSYDCTGSLADTVAVDYPASSPSAVAVGGTKLTESSPGAGDWRETAWGPVVSTSAHPIVASGGGVSSRFAAPAYQVATGTAGTRRSLPDIASSADGRLGFLMYGSSWRKCGTTISWCGAWLSAGGTSSGAPVQAALFASAMSTYGAARPNVGSLHDLLYGNRDALRDIVGGTGGRNLAGRGYDRVTGLGVPIWTTLLARLARPALQLPAATAVTTVPIRVTDLTHTVVDGYAYGENLTSCPGSPVVQAAPTSITLADGPGRAATIGVCVFAGGTATLLTRVVKLDRTAPTVTPRIDLSSSSSVQARWDADDAGGSGAVSYAVTITRATDGAVVWQHVRELPYLTIALSPGTTYRIKASATDAAGNAGHAVTSDALPVPYDDRSLSPRGSWQRVTDAPSYHRSYFRSAARGASMSRVVTGTSVALLAHTSADGGSANVYVDGHLIRRVSLYASGTHRDVELPLASWSRRGKHTVKIVVTGAQPRGSSGRMVRVDGLSVR